MTDTTLTEALRDTLRQHGMSRGMGRCRCGAWWTAADEYGNADQFRDHIAAELGAAVEAIVAARLADVRALADEWERNQGRHELQGERWVAPHVAALRAVADGQAPAHEEGQP